MIDVVGWLACAFVAASIASAKNRNVAVWLLWGVVSGPLALIMVGIMPAVPRASAIYRPEHLPELRECPHCITPIPLEASVCRYCLRNVEPLRPFRPNPPPASRFSHLNMSPLSDEERKRMFRG